jgi:Domain of unknown function (DUF4430)
VIAARNLAVVVALGAMAAAGCGLGPGKDEGDVSLIVSRDYGSKVLVQKDDSIHESDTVFRVLDRNAEVDTRYGGGFVQSIDGLAGAQSGGRGSDWFFYVNGIESPVGSTAYDLSGDDRIWWDYRDWTAAMRVPAVVGSWPEPFVHGFEGEHWPAVLDCHASAPTCAAASDKLSPVGVKTSTGPVANPLLVEVGTWDEVRSDRTVSLLAGGPDQSGVFARFVGAGKPLLELLNQQGQPAGSVGKGGGLIAALREGDGPPTWVVTGTDEKGVAAAASLLGPTLRNHYAVATQPGAGAIGVPVQ